MSVATRQSATAAAKMAISQGRAADTAASISCAVSTVTRSTPAGIGKLARSGDERYAGAEGARLRGDGHALLAGRTVGDIAHRVDRLERGTAGDDHVSSGQRTCCARVRAGLSVSLRGMLRRCGMSQRVDDRRQQLGTSARRPGPASPASAISPTAGPTKKIPSASSRATCCAASRR